MSPKSEEEKSNQVIQPQTKQKNSQSRRAFVKRVLAAGAAANIANLALSPAAEAEGFITSQPGGICQPGQITGSCQSPSDRRLKAYQIRTQAAQQQYFQSVPPHPNNGDEQRFANKIGSYTKGLPHNNLGEVDLAAYQIYQNALCTGNPADFEKIPPGCPDPANRYLLVDPQGGLAFDMEGVDSHATFMPPAPAVGSAQETGEMIELYWMALTRDVPFSEYDTNPLTQAAAADLSTLSDFRGPKVGGASHHRHVVP